MANNVILGGFFLLLITIFFTDFKKREVSNYQVLVALFLCVVASFIFGYELNYKLSLYALLIGFLLWKIKLFGAADVKLICVYLLCIEQENLIDFLFLMSVFGFLIGIFVLLFFKNKSVPYAPAIATSHIIVFYELYFKGL